MQTDQEYLTKEKFKELEKELEYLKTIKRKEVAESLEYAKSLGDLSENQEYQEARDAQAVLEDRIGRLENILKSASIVSANQSSVVGVGSLMTVERESDKT
ncbi:MAG: transcription elongation factor GreA, partial [bacterium]|nr:transcription elongation factor GreA [bacterium]